LLQVEGSAYPRPYAARFYDVASQFGFEYRNTALNTLTVTLLTQNVARNPVSELLQTRLGRKNNRLFFGNYFGSGLQTTFFTRITFLLLI
jgi:hypothetical protein